MTASNENKTQSDKPASGASLATAGDGSFAVCRGVRLRLAVAAYAAAFSMLALVEAQATNPRWQWDGDEVAGQARILQGAGIRAAALLPGVSDETNFERSVEAVKSGAAPQPFENPTAVPELRLWRAIEKMAGQKVEAQPRDPLDVKAMPTRWMTASTGANLRDEHHCMALNIYFEARGESHEGRVAVGHVVLNRVADQRYPSTVCGVVRQGGERVRYRCQFSWWCDGLSDRPRNQPVWEESQLVAWLLLQGRMSDPTDGALWYHADYVMPYWGRIFKAGPKIGRHIFYVEGDSKPVQVAARQEAQ